MPQDQVRPRVDSGLPPSPTVSVVIPCFNYGRFLAEAVASAFAQTVPPHEVLVIDDGSTDDTAVVARAAGARLVQQTNGGFAAARNRGAREARGELVVFLDADDRLDPGYLDQCLTAYASADGRRFTYTQWRTFGECAPEVSSWPAYSVERLVVSNFIPITVLLPRQAVLDHPFRSSLRHAYEDWDFQLTLAEHGYRGILVDAPLLEYRQHARSAIATFHHDEEVVRRTILLIALRHHRLFGRTRIRTLAGEYYGAVRSRVLDRLRGRR